MGKPRNKKPIKKNRIKSCVVASIFAAALAGIVYLHNAAKPKMTADFVQKYSLSGIPESSRQKYLDTLLKEEIATNQEWSAIEKIVYDPGLKKESHEDVSEGGYKDHPSKQNLVPLAHTKIKRMKEKSAVYVSENAFDPRYINSQDELESLMDNEASSADVGLRGSFIVTDKYGQPSGKHNPEMEELVLEVVSFDYQLANILNGTRKVSTDFSDKIIDTYKPLYEILKNKTLEDSEDGRYAKVIFESLRVAERGNQ